MAVILDEMNLPRSCSMCNLSYCDSDGDIWCPWYNSTMNDYDTKRYEHCPLHQAETKDCFVYNIVEEAENDKD